MQHFFHCPFRFIEVPDEPKSAFTWKISCCTRVFRDHRPPECKERRRPIAYPTGLPGYIDALDGRKFPKPARHVSTIRTRRARNPVRIDNAPAKLLQTRPLRIVRADIHRQLELRLWHACW